MKAKIYYPNEELNKKNVNKNLFVRMWFLIGLLFYFVPVSGQNYFGVTNLSGTSTEDGIGVTVTSTGNVSSYYGCTTGLSSPYWEGFNGATAGPGGYTWTFSVPVQAVRIHIDAIEMQDTTTILINGVPYFLTSANISPLLIPCYYTETAVASASGLLVDTASGSSATIDINLGGGINSVSVLSNGNFIDEGVLNDMMFGYNYPPSFVNGSPQNFSLCAGGTYDISAMLAVNDIDTGQNEIWSVVSGPSNGVVVASFAATSTGGTLTPSGLSYTPASGYSGNDSFTVQVNDGNGGVATTTFYVVVNALPVISVDSVTAQCAGVTMTNLYYSGIVGTLPAVTFNFTGGMQTWTVPAGVTMINIDAQGAAGGLNNYDSSGFQDTASYGGRVQATLAVTPGQVLNIYVGGAGGNAPAMAGGIGGYNGGGAGGFDSTQYGGGGGGGATDIRIGDTMLTSRMIVGGGGGGAGLTCGGNEDVGGAGGGLTGMNGSDSCAISNSLGIAYGGGGTASGGGFGGVCGGCSGMPGTMGALDTGGSGGIYTPGGGGGAGYYGGGGGQWEGGGGGSSYTDPVLASGVTHTQGYNPGNGLVIISYNAATTYSIVWGGAADSAGFTGITNDTLLVSPISVAIPATAAANTYTGTIVVNNGICMGTGSPFSVTVNPIPALSSPVSNGYICDSTLFSYVPVSTVAGTIFAWTRATVSGISNPAASGTGNIAETLVNSTTDSIGVTYVYVLTANACMSTQNITVTVDPLLVMSNAIAAAPVCDSMLFSYMPTGATAFTWSRSATTGIDNPPASGMDSISEFLVNTTPYPIPVSYTDTVTISGCMNVQSIMVTVNPTPLLNSATVSNPICDSQTYSYIPSSLTPGTTYSWFRDTVAGITNPVGYGFGSTGVINEMLGNITPYPITVTYQYTLYANGCTGTENVSLVVNPKPLLSSSTLPNPVCDSTLFSYLPASATPGTDFSWSRGVTAGISNGASSGLDSIDEVLVNTTSGSVPVIYTDTLQANGCENIQNITVVVYPKPMLSSPVSWPAICDSSTFTYIPSSATPGTAFSWSRGVIAGLGNPAASGMDSISEMLTNTTDSSVMVTYVDTLKANGCVNTEDVTVTVYPVLTLSSSVTPPGICSNQKFDYTPMSSFTGATFNWVRPFVLGIDLPAGSGTGNPDETLDNTTNDNLVVSYIFTIMADGCSNNEIVTDTVHPTPTLSSGLAETVCSGTPFNYYPTGFVFGTTYFWVQGYTVGLSPAQDTGSGNIHETITDSTMAPVRTVYTITLTANGCTNNEQVALTVNPAPAQPAITTYPDGPLCTNTMYQNFGTASAAPAGLEYYWSADNATIYATGSGHQYCLVNFNSPGAVTITLNYNVPGVSCITSNSFTANVGSSYADMPQVVYFEGQFVCLQNNEDSYQWGFDDNVTLDSTLIAGEINPNYFISAPDLANKHYWVMTMKDGCSQKTYYNTPTGITNVNSSIAAEMKVYPNPTSDYLNVDINAGLDGNIQVSLLNILGQQLGETAVVNHQAKIDVSKLPAGCYLVDCYREGVKIATARFIKN